MTKIFRLKEDLPMDEDRFGVRRSGGVSKAGTLYELIREPVPEKKMYKLTTLGEKWPHNLYLRKSEFKRLLEEITHQEAYSLYRDKQLEEIEV